MIVAPFKTVMCRFEDQTPAVDSIETSGVVNALLSATGKAAGDYTVTVPARLLEKKRQTRFIFNIVMICMAGISLLVGGIAS